MAPRYPIVLGSLSGRDCGEVVCRILRLRGTSVSLVFLTTGGSRVSGRALLGVFARQMSRSVLCGFFISFVLNTESLS